MARLISFPGVLSGFHVENPSQTAPELTHVGEAWVPAEYKIVWHEHRVWEFYYQIDGSTDWRSRGKQFRVGSGSLLAVAPGVPHALIDKSNTSHHYYYAGVDLEAVFRRMPQLRRAFGHKKLFNCPHVEALATPFKQLIREVSLNHAFRSDGLRTSINSLIIEIARSLVERPSKSIILMHPSVRRACEFLDQRPQEAWTTLKLARMSGISVSRLNECFRRDLSISPHQYLMQRRLDLASELLRQTTQAVTKMALDLGFSSSQHFALAFRKRFGVSASKYRLGQTK